VKLYRGPPMTLGVAAAAGVGLIVWCKGMPASGRARPAEMASRYGARNVRARLVPAAGLFPLRRPAGRYGGDRNETMIGERSSAEIPEEERRSNPKASKS
jgi:hypothetical protein